MALVHRVFHGSDRVATRRFCAALQQQGHIGCIAAALFHAQKSSSRAKRYRGGIPCDNGRPLTYKKLAYERKGDFVERLADLLSQDDCGMRWGWGVDANESDAPHVLYIDLPQGQVSFHSTKRFSGPEYPAKWDGTRASAERILTFCNVVSNGRLAESSGKAVPAQEIKEKD